MSATKQFCTFNIGDLYFGIEVSKVQEVLRHQEWTRVPLAHSAVSGLINLRGQIVTAIDLRLRLGLSARTGDTLPLNVVVRTDDGTLSLLVDGIGDVIEVNDDTFERPPETLRGCARELVTGLYKLNSRLLLILDTERTTNLTSAAQ